MTYVLYAQVGGKGAPMHHILTTDDKAWCDSNAAHFAEAGVKVRIEEIAEKKGAPR